MAPVPGPKAALELAKASAEKQDSNVGVHCAQLKMNVILLYLE